MGTVATATPADMIAYQSELVRTGQYLPLGRMQKIAIGPSAAWRAPAPDAFIARYGRMIDLRGRFLPLAQSRDKNLLLITGRITPLGDGRIGLPDVPDPTWTPPAMTREEVEGREVRKVVNGREVIAREVVAPDPARHTPRMLAQRLTDRCELSPDGQPGVLEGTNFLIFQPVLRVLFQPEIENRLAGTAWTLNFCNPDGSMRLDGAGQCCVLLIDHKTGECQFLGGRYDIETGFGE